MNCCRRLTFTVFRIGIQIYEWLYPKQYTPVPTHNVSAAKLPWLFVGIELDDGSILDKTAHVQDLLECKVPLSLHNICMLEDRRRIRRCFYLDEKTLKEEEIPAHGITIHDS